MKTTGWQEKDDYTISELRTLLAAEKIDLFIPWKSPHLAYLLNYYDKLHGTIFWDEMISVLCIPADSGAFIAGAIHHWTGIEEDRLSPWWLEERYPCWGNAYQVFDETARVISEKGLANKRIGIEKRFMPLKAYEYLRKVLPEAEFVEADYIVPQIRLAKTPREQSIMKYACDAGLRANEAYMRALRKGRSIQEAILERAKTALDYGVEYAGGAAGISWTGGTDITPAWWDPEIRRAYEKNPRGKTWNEIPFFNEVQVSHGETVYQHYFSDFAWHEFIHGEPGDDALFTLGPEGGSIDGSDSKDGVKREVSYRELKEDFRIIREVQHNAIQGIKPGMNQFEAHQSVMDYFKEHPEHRARITYCFLHSLGLEVHEEPMIACRSLEHPNFIPEKEPISYKVGMVMSSEWFTSYWTVEEPYLLTETGWIPLVERRGICLPE
jgi:Xaa-Pro aminopeptidase